MLPFRPRPARSLRALPRRLPRTALPWWLAVLVLAAVTFGVVRGAEARASEAEAHWRATRMVVVATRSLAVGDALDGATELRRLPAAAVPRHALTVVPRGAVAMAAIDAGEVLSALRVSGERAAGTAALLPPGTRALLVPVEVAGLPVAAGDRVDLLAAGSGDLPVAAKGRVVARRALVVSATSRALVVAVAEDRAADVAAALGQGPIIPALVGPNG